MRYLIVALTTVISVLTTSCGAKDQAVAEHDYLDFRPDSALGAALRIDLAKRLPESADQLIAADSLTWLALRGAGFRDVQWRPRDAAKMPRCPWDSTSSRPDPATPFGFRVRVRTERDSADFIYASLEKECVEQGNQGFTRMSSWEVQRLRTGWKLLRPSEERITEVQRARRLTKVGADGRVSEAGGRPRFIVP